MSESDSFISEVSEEVRRERLFGYLRRYGWLIAALVLLVVGGAAVNEWRKSRAVIRAEADGAALHAAYLTTQAEARAVELADLAAATPQAAPLMRTAQAGALIDAGVEAEAASVLGAIAEGDGAADLYRALAALQRVMVLGTGMDPDQRLATIETLAAEGAPFRLLALEQRALLQLEAGETEAALADLREVLAAPDAPEALSGRVRQLIVAAGGALPPEDAGGALPPEGAGGAFAPEDAGTGGAPPVSGG